MNELGIDLLNPNTSFANRMVNPNIELGNNADIEHDISEAERASNKQLAQEIEDMKEEIRILEEKKSRLDDELKHWLKILEDIEEMETRHNAGLATIIQSYQKMTVIKNEIEELEKKGRS